jgi:spermidine/putrescine transport system permease protein
VEERGQFGLVQRIRKFLTAQEHLPYVGPVSLWIFLFVIAPLAVILYFSFLSTGPLGQLVPTITLKNYLGLWKVGNAIIMLRSVLFASGANMICLLTGYPVAYFIARQGGRWKTLLLSLVILPSWTCYVIRLYALRTLAADEGLINSVLLNLGLISSPLHMLYNSFAVMVGLIYAWLPFMVLPIYASLESLDPSLFEAAEDLGATPFRRFFTVTLPLTKGGVFAGTILVFIPCFGEWLVPQFLGGNKVMFAGNLVEHYFLRIGYIPQGSTIAVAIAAIVLLIIYVSMKLGGEEALERII